MTVKAGLCRTWSETQIVGFLMQWLNSKLLSTGMWHKSYTVPSIISVAMSATTTITERITVPSTIPTEVAIGSDRRHPSVVATAVEVATTTIPPITAVTTIPATIATVRVVGDIRRSTGIGGVTDTGDVQRIPHLLVRWVSCDGGNVLRVDVERHGPG